MRNRARYSSTFQVREEYLLVRPLISNAATRNQDQCKNKSIPPTRNSRNEPGRMLVMRENYNIIIACSWRIRRATLSKSRLGLLPPVLARSDVETARRLDH